jgi:integrase
VITVLREVRPHRPDHLLIATGLRRSELLVLRWVDFDEKAGVRTITGKVIRVPARGCCASTRPSRPPAGAPPRLPRFAIEMLQKRRHLPYVGQQAGDLPMHRRHPARPEQLPETVAHRTGGTRRRRRDTHSFRKAVATLVDDEGLSARIGADYLGHSHVSLTQDRYMSRGRIHTQVAACWTGPSA